MVVVGVVVNAVVVVVDKKAVVGLVSVVLSCSSPMIGNPNRFQYN